MAEPCTVDDAGGLATGPNPAMSSELSRQDAEANLGRDMGDRILAEYFRCGGHFGSIPLAPDVTLKVVELATKRFSTVRGIMVYVSPCGDQLGLRFDY